MPEVTVSTVAHSTPFPNNLTSDREVADRLQRAIGKLNAEDQRTIRSFLRSELTKEDREALERVTSTAGFRGASVEGLTSILHHLAVGQRAGQNGAEMSWVLREPQFLRLGGADQSKIVALLSVEPRQALLAESLGQLLQRTMPDGTPAILSRDSSGTTLLDRLTEISAMTVHRDLAAARMPGATRPITSGEALRAVVQECGRPAQQVDQGSRGACGAASMQDLLCKSQPAEYARLVLGLFTRKEATLAGGGTIRVVPDSIVPSPAPDTNNPDLRSHPERIFQSAMLDYTDTVFRYSYMRDSKGIPRDSSPVLRALSQITGGTDPNISVMSGGMRNDEMIRGLEGLFGRRYTAAGGTGSEIHTALRSSRAPALIAMTWSTGQHALVYCGTHDGWVYLKDPNGGVGEDTSGPRRENTSLHGANIRMRSEDFERNVRNAFIPSPPPAPLPAIAPLLLPAVPVIKKQAERVLETVPTPKEALERLAEANREVERNVGQLLLPPLMPARAAFRWLKQQ